MFDPTIVFSGQYKLAELASDLTLDDLKALTNRQIDEMLAQIHDLSDAQVVFAATDPQAEGGMGWNVTHLITHTTATSDESAVVSSILARGITYAFEPRLRVEIDWATLTTPAACRQRLEESRRIRLAYLNAWPDQPRLDTFYGVPARLAERLGSINAIGTYLLGLAHEATHFAQLREIVGQARK